MSRSVVLLGKSKFLDFVQILLRRFDFLYSKLTHSFLSLLSSFFLCLKFNSLFNVEQNVFFSCNLISIQLLYALKSIRFGRKIVTLRNSLIKLAFWCVLFSFGAFFHFTKVFLFSDPNTIEALAYSCTLNGSLVVKRE